MTIFRSHKTGGLYLIYRNTPRGILGWYHTANALYGAPQIEGHVRVEDFTAVAHR